MKRRGNNTKDKIKHDKVKTEDPVKIFKTSIS